MINWIAITVTALSLMQTAHAEKLPRTGTANPDYEELDTAIVKFMETIDASAATVAVSKKDSILYSRGFGWKDTKKTIPTPPDTLFRIASLSKMFTAAAVYALIDKRRLKLNDKALAILDIEPYNGKLGDDRLKEITIEHLLEHKGGWDRDKSNDPLFYPKRIAEKLELERLPTARDVVRYMLSQKLDTAPGEVRTYSNFGYCMLGQILAQKLNRQTYFEALQLAVLNPHKIKDVIVGQDKTRDPREVDYPFETTPYHLDFLTANGGLVASAPAVAEFLMHYWIMGKARDRLDGYNYIYFGSLPGTTALARQYTDGTNVVVLFNNRRELQYNADDDDLVQAIDKLLKPIDK